MRRPSAKQGGSARVMLLELTFEGKKDRDKWTTDWKKLAQKVRNEFNYLSCETRVEMRSDTTCMSYERIVTRERVSTQECIAAHRERMLQVDTQPISFELTQFKDSELGNLYNSRQA